MEENIQDTGADVREQMRFIDYMKPPMKNGVYNIHAVQSLTAPESHEFEEHAEFYIAGHAFRVPKEEIFSIYPQDNQTGQFEDLLPFLVMDNRTFPWEYSICGERDGVPVPWVALLVVSENEGAQEKDMTIGELLEKSEEGIYYPDRKKLPTVFAEKSTDICHVLDLPRSLYDAIMPSVDDLTYLCHARSVNLKQTEDSVCAKDGFFSVICGNRFIPSGEGTPVKSSIHLVSLLGMEKLTELPECEKVRLVSLYHWEVFSQKKSEENFEAVIQRLSKNCSSIYASMDTELKRQGYSIKKHNMRTGEQTYSMYRSPLLPFANREMQQPAQAHTADGRLIYDRRLGIFDVTYAAAWQLGRLLALSHPADTEKILRVRKERKLKLHQGRQNADSELQSESVKWLMGLIAEKNILSEGGCNEEKTTDTPDGGCVASVFRGYR